tara:strand:+ start:439 stop:3441 length:3003 start_codon:yes stop_codon:yes gene_type:complete
MVGFGKKKHPAFKEKHKKKDAVVTENPNWGNIDGGIRTRGGVIKNGKFISHPKYFNKNNQVSSSEVATGVADNKTDTKEKRLFSHNLDAGVSSITNNLQPQPFPPNNHPEHDRGNNENLDDENLNYINTVTNAQANAQKESETLSHKEVKKIKDKVEKANSKHIYKDAINDPVKVEPNSNHENHEVYNKFQRETDKPVITGPINPHEGMEIPTEGDYNVANQIHGHRALEKEKTKENNFEFKLSDQEKSIIHFFQRNVLLDYDGPTYNFELQMLHEDDAIRAQRYIVKGEKSFNDWKPTIQPITVAETASTVMNIQGVQITAVGGPISSAHRVSGAVDFMITMAQPLGESLTTILVNSAVKLGMPDGLKATYLLKLHFVGRKPETGEVVKPIPQTERQFLINIIGVETSVDTSGAIYGLQCIRAGDQGKYDHVITTDRPLQLNNIRTVKNLCDEVALAINLNEIDKLAIEKETLDEYYIHLSPGAKKFIGDDQIVPTDELKESNADTRSTGTDKELWDPHLRSFVIPQDTSLDRILEFGLSHSKKMQNLAKGFNPDDDDPDSNDSNKVENYIKYIFKIKCDVVNIAWDKLRNDYAREYHYTVSLFPTIRPEILQGIFNRQPEVAEKKITALINENFGGEEGQTKPYKCMRKRYDYLFTGLNDKVLRFDIKYNNNFFMALQSYQNLFTGLDDTTQTKIKKSSAKINEFRKQQKQVEDAWKNYLKTKAESLEIKDKIMKDALKSGLSNFEKERKELISQFVAGIKDGTFEVDSSLANSLESINTKEDRQLATYGGTKIVEDEFGNKKQVHVQGRMNDDSKIPVSVDGQAFKQIYAEKINEEKLRSTIEALDSPVTVMWGLNRSDSGKYNSEGHPKNKGKHHFDMVMEGALSDLQADMVQMDMEIRGDMFWLESENDPDEFSVSTFLGENYLLFTARTSAGEPSLETGIATPGDTHKERLLNGVYAATQITSRFEGGMFTQNIKGPRETFIYNTNTLESFGEK